MTIQNQMNRIIDHLSSIGDSVGCVEISKSGTVRCYSANEQKKNCVVYFTIYSIYSTDQIEQMTEEDRDYEIDKRQGDEERDAFELYQSLQNEHVAREFGPNY